MKKQVISSIRWVALETAVSRLLALVSIFYVARVLGPEAMGLVALVVVALEVFRLFSQLGISQALIHHKEPKKKQIATLYTINWVLALVVYGLVIIFSEDIAGLFSQPVLANLLVVAGINLPINALGQQIITLLQKELRFKVIAIITMIGAIVNFVTTVSLVNLGYGVWSIIFATLFGNLFVHISTFIFGVGKGLFNGFGFNFSSVKPMLRFGLFQTGAMTLNTLNSRADQLIIGGAIGSAALGVYNVASNATLAPMQQINSIATRVAFPVISKIQDDRDTVKSAYMRLLGTTLLINAPLLMGLSLLSKPFVQLVLGADWGELSTVLSILCFYALFRSIGNVTGSLVLGLGKANWEFYWNLSLSFCIPAIIYVVAQEGSIELIASTLLILQIILGIIAYFYWIRPLLGSCGKEYALTIARPIASSFVMYVSLMAFLTYFSVDLAFFTFIYTIIGGAFIYGIASFFLNRESLAFQLSVIRR